MCRSMRASGKSKGRMDTKEKWDIKVSIIMGVYNPEHEEWLKASICSMIDQSLTEWEMILYDDGSDAVYKERIEKAAKMDQRIRLIRGRENRGLAYALNQCLKHAKGRYVARMDDDDISMPERLEKQYQFLEKNQEFGWAGTTAALFDAGGIWGKEELSEIPGAEDFLKHSPYIHPSVMFRSEVLKHAGGYLAARRTKRCEDYELFMRLCAEGLRGYNIQEELFLYREDYRSYRKRKMKYRLFEMQIRYQGFQKLHILTPASLPYVLRPLVGGLPGIGTGWRIFRRKYKEIQNRKNDLWRNEDGQ